MARFGSPLFVFSERKIRSQYREVYNAFSRRYPNVAFAWSYKTNYLGAICAIMHQEGALAEVVSEMEYAKARAWACPASRSSSTAPSSRCRRWSGPSPKGPPINVDHLDEICDLEDDRRASSAASSRSGCG